MLRQRAWHADRVQRVSLLAAAIARELNQPVSAILRNAQAGLKTLSRDNADPHALRDILESVVREDTRAAETIRTMRNPRVEAALVCVIDDDPAARLDLLRLLGEKGWQAKAYASADAFLAEQPPGAEVACVLLDIPMPDRCGLELQRQLVLRACAPGVIFISGHGDVATGVEAMKLGAADFLVKPVDAKVLVEAVGKAVAHYQVRREQVLSQSSLMRRISSLSTRERQIMEHVIEGRLNKQIAADLLITEQTVKQHRGRVMDKMEVKSVAQLVRACEATGLFPALK